MAQYKLGTISITNGTNVVTGSSTQFLANVAVGNSFKVAGVNALYSVIAVDSDTQIRISPNYAGTTVSGAQYQISTSFTPNLNLAEIETGDSEFAFHLTHEVIRKLDAAIPDYTMALAGKSPLAGPGSGQAFSVGALSAAGVATTKGSIQDDVGRTGWNLIGSTTTYIGTSSATVLGFVTNNINVGRFTSTGTFLLNTDTDNGSGAKLQVAGGINSTGEIVAGGILASTGGYAVQSNGARPAGNYQWNLEYVSNTQVKLWLKGSDGVDRSTTLNLA